MIWTNLNGWHFAFSQTLTFRIESHSLKAKPGTPFLVDVFRGRSFKVHASTQCRTLQDAKDWAVRFEQNNPALRALPAPKTPRLISHRASA